MTSPTDALSKIWLDLGLPADALERVRLTGTEPALPSSFRVGTAAQASIAAASLAAAEVWRLRGGPAAEVTVDMRHAAIEFRSERYFSVEGRPPPALWDKIAGTYRCGDGRWLRIHTNFPHHRDGILELLKCDYAREAVQEALDGWTAEAFETAAGAVGMIAAMMRSKAEWLAHPQGQAVASLPLISIEKIGEAAPEPLPPAARPLDSLRVLDLTRIIAGPVCGRALAAHGAEVLYVTGPHLPAIAPLVIDTGRGKRSTQIDLREPAGTAALAALLEDADLFVQGYRPGGLAERGFSPEEAAALRPGIVYLSLSAYGHSGPWAGKRGFDSIAQTTIGINHQEAAMLGLDHPKELPCQALDHASGYLLALGAMAGLMRRAREGGSWHVRVALARTGHWLQDLGPLEGGFDCQDPGLEDVGDLLETSESGFGRLSAVRHAGRIGGASAVWRQPAVPLGSHPPAWSRPAA